MVGGIDPIQDTGCPNYVRHSRGGLDMGEDMLATFYRIQYRYFLGPRIGIFKTSKQNGIAAKGGSN